ncbi:ATP-binding protein [Streptomyces sp. HUAS ZL42]|uniref:ATP-binding protein n=1 Tax=Streptomyces sp. HUAS ZL42 TaxID=3231715 RepID=UPI00345E29E1
MPGYSALLPCRPQSVPCARRLVTSALGAWDMDVLADDAELIVSELLTNAIDHTHCCFARVMVQRPLEHRVRVSVADASAALPTLSPAGGWAERGRGLMLVDALSTQWGYDRHPGYKTTWAELHLPATTPSPSAPTPGAALATADHPTAVRAAARCPACDEAGR